ncbi:MAG: hypothetical protein M0Z82_03650 [Actinomycetota bacterium]|nr:hypothetical protein [Actinomycetota bacterium]
MAGRVAVDRVRRRLTSGDELLGDDGGVSTEDAGTATAGAAGIG